jgi:SpoIID/LytB domain protein
MKRIIMILTVFILVISMMTNVMGAVDTAEDIFSGLDRRDEDDFPEMVDFDTGITIQASISEVNEEGIPIVRVRLRPGSAFTTMGFVGTNGAAIQIRDGITGEVRGTTSSNQAFTVKTISTGVRIDELNITAVSVILQPVNPADRINVAWSSTTARNYRGTLEVGKVSNSTSIIFINELNLEDYLLGVVPNEMPGSWPSEALKAQAISARTYTLANINKHSTFGYNLCDWSGCCQAYLTSSNEHSNTTAAVIATKGKVASYQGKLITTYYSSSTGGYTESYYNWGGFTDPTKPNYNPPHLQSVPDPFDLNSANSRGTWVRTFTLDELSAHFSTKGVGQVTSIESTKPLTESGRQMEVTVRGTSGNYTVSGQSNIRKAFAFWSARFSIIPRLAFKELIQKDWASAELLPVISGGNNTSTAEVKGMHIVGADNVVVLEGVPVVAGYVEKPSQYEFAGGGWGHGVGMSQYGAYGMAVAGKSCDEIMKHYYQGIDIVTAY